jgi:diguanylate cyclase
MGERPLRVNRKNFAEQLAERVSEAVRNEVTLVDNQEIRVTISIGIAELELGENAAAWLKRADTALYEAKNAGRDRYLFAAPSTDSEGEATPDS